MTSATQLEAAQRDFLGGRLAAAERGFAAVLARHPQSVDALFGLGTVKMQQGQLEAAERLIAGAVHREPGQAEFVFNLALLYKKQRRTDESVRAFQHAAALAPTDRQILSRAGRELLELSQPAAAYRLLSASTSPDAETSILTARAAAGMGNHGEALRLLSAVAGEGSTSPKLWLELAQAAGHLRDYDRAIAAFVRHMELLPDERTALLGLADLYLMAHRLGDAAEAIHRALEFDPRSAEAHNIAGKCKRLAGERLHAIAEFETAIEIDPALGQPWGALAELADPDRLGALAERCRHGLQTSAGKPYDRMLRQFALGRMEERCGDRAAAWRAYRAANKLQKQSLQQSGTPYQAQEEQALVDGIIGKFPQRPPAPSVAAADCVPIFIVGMPRSGTTLMERILGGLAGVRTGGENEAVAFIATDYYWRLERGELPPPMQMSGALWGALAQRYWERTAARGTHLTDKMPHNLQHLGLIAGMFPTSPIIVMRRDPRDVCLSIYSRPFPSGHRYACDLEWLAHYYGQQLRLMAHWQRILPERIFQVSYEALVSNPREVSQSVAEHCALAWRAECLAVEERVSSSFTFSELQVRERINQQGVGRWRGFEQLQPLIEALEAHGVL